MENILSSNLNVLNTARKDTSKFSINIAELVRCLLIITYVYF
jgi:hypothetical protein